MYFWDTDALVEDLKKGPLSESEQLKYLLFEVGTTAFVMSAPPETAEPLTLVSAINVLSSVVLAVGGTVWCYRTNAAGDNRDFVSRYLALLVPLTLRLMALLAIGGLTLGAAFGLAFLGSLAEPGGLSGVIQLALGILIFVALYWRVNTRIREVCRVG